MLIHAASAYAAPPAPQNLLPGRTADASHFSPSPPVPAESVSQDAETARSAETARLGAQTRPALQPMPSLSTLSETQQYLRRIDLDPATPSPRDAVQAYEASARSRGEDARFGGLNAQA